MCWILLVGCDGISIASTGQTDAVVVALGLKQVFGILFVVVE